MASTSFRFADYSARPDRAVGHIHVDGRYEPLYVRDPDTEAPAGGASSSLNDMTRWLTMMLANGRHEGKQLVDPKALLPAVTPQIVSSRASEPAMRSGFYGYGFNVAPTSAARMELSHSGAFELGSGTNFVILPSADVAIVAMTNATPSGVPEALTAEFADLVQFGERVAEGMTNDVPTRAARSVSDIVRANVFTRINAILGVLLVIVLSTGSVINGLFGLLIIANSAIGIIQELRAKQTLDKLAIVGQAKPLVRRQFGTAALLPTEVVLDDVIEIGPGDQIVVDGEVLEENNLEVDESLLTGEADPIVKDAGDNVMSGSFVVAGSGAYRATKVGREAYAAKLSDEASKFTLVKSGLRMG